MTFFSVLLIIPILLLIAMFSSGTTVKYVLEQDKAAFIRLIGVSVLQSGASSFIAPSIRSYSLVFHKLVPTLLH